ncbi:hypothetical protein DID75_04690 [Candidatus Marinamargulisbacteria bacterium SCGC AG-410-N11]|nr:hypothetical protein DID75_04690 [Candidatus Marinamargulisbacteria bacterium SCGC AG-410-N11]
MKKKIISVKKTTLRNRRQLKKDLSINCNFPAISFLSRIEEDSTKIHSTKVTNPDTVQKRVKPKSTQIGRARSSILFENKNLLKKISLILVNEIAQKSLQKNIEFNLNDNTVINRYVPRVMELVLIKSLLDRSHANPFILKDETIVSINLGAKTQLQSFLNGNVSKEDTIPLLTNKNYEYGADISFSIKKGSNQPIKTCIQLKTIGFEKKKLVFYPNSANKIKLADNLLTNKNRGSVKTKIAHALSQLAGKFNELSGVAAKNKMIVLMIQVNVKQPQSSNINPAEHVTAAQILSIYKEEGLKKILQKKLIKKKVIEIKKSTDSKVTLIVCLTTHKVKDQLTKVIEAQSKNKRSSVHKDLLSSINNKHAASIKYEL